MRKCFPGGSGVSRRKTQLQSANLLGDPMLPFFCASALTSIWAGISFCSVKQLPLTAAVQLHDPRLLACDSADIGLRGRQLLFSPFRGPLGRESPSSWSGGRIDSTFLAATKIAAVMFLPVRLETKGRPRGHSELNISRYR